MDTLSVEYLILIIFAAILMFMALSLLVFGITAYKIAALYAPEPEKPRRVPRFGGAAAAIVPADNETGEPAEPGENGWPKVAATEVGSQIAGAAEMMLTGEREKWWEEKREEGYSDDEIAAEEAAQVVPVFEE